MKQINVGQLGGRVCVHAGIKRGRGPGVGAVPRVKGGGGGRF